MNDLAHLPPPPDSPMPAPPGPRRPSRAGWLVVPAIIVFALIANGGLERRAGRQSECGLACEGGAGGVIVGLFLLVAVPASLVVLLVVLAIARSGTASKDDR